MKTPLQGTIPQHGMSREECDALLCDLQDAGIEVLRVDEVQPGQFCPYCHCPDPDHCYWITNAKLFRETVAAGWHADIPAGALTPKFS